MSTELQAEIHVGGTVTAAVARDLLLAALADHVLLDWGEAPWRPDPDDTIQEALAVLDGDTTLVFYVDHASWGRVAHLEDFCRANQVPYDRYTQGNYEYMSELAYFRPGMDQPRVLATDTEQREVVARDLLRPALEMLRKGLAVEALHYLEEALGPEVPGLPDFEIVD